MTDFHTEVDLAVLREQVAELESDLDGISSENADLEQDNDTLKDAIRDALSDLGSIDDVPFGQVAEYVAAVVRELRAVIV